MKKLSREEVIKEIKKGASIVDSWPSWKQNCLTQGSKSQNETPRIPITKEEGY